MLIYWIYHSGNALSVAVVSVFYVVNINACLFLSDYVCKM